MLVGWSGMGFVLTELGLGGRKELMIGGLVWDGLSVDKSEKEGGGVKGRRVVCSWVSDCQWFRMEWVWSRGANHYGFAILF